jgi:hypothetical protein
MTKHILLFLILLISITSFSQITADLLIVGESKGTFSASRTVVSTIAPNINTYITLFSGSPGGNFYF